jgi:O-antigen ligase
VWALLVVNTLAFNGVSILPFPHAAGQVITMGALAGALLLVVVRNRRLLIRPSLFMTLVSLLALAAAASSARMEPGPGALLRATRYLVVVACLWLLTPLWRNPTALLRHHLRTSIGVLGLVAVGIVASGGRSLHGDQGRLVGAIWPMPPPQVAQFAAVLAGLAGTAWMTGLLSGRTAALTAVPALLLLLATHTRTAMAGLVVGLALAAGSALLSSRRAANFLVCVLAIAAVAATAAGGFVMHWLQRGESSQDLANLSGRQIVWGVLLAQPRSTADRFVGTGLSDKSFGGLSIDSTWLSVYWEQGLIGLALVAMIFVVLVLGVLSARPSPGRTVAVFLTGYLLMASWTEVGLGDADTYLLLAFLAAACMDHPWAPDGDPS